MHRVVFLQSVTVSASADFTSATDANSFHDWLKQYVSDNSGDFQEAETRVHDCNHTQDGDPNKRCPIGDAWSL